MFVDLKVVEDFYRKFHRYEKKMKMKLFLQTRYKSTRVLFKGSIFLVETQNMAMVAHHR
jgi:hypothetical protein